MELESYLILTLLAVSPFAAIRSAPTAGSGHAISKSGNSWLMVSGQTDGVNPAMLKQ